MRLKKYKVQLPSGKIVIVEAHNELIAKSNARKIYNLNFRDEVIVRGEKRRGR